MNRFANEFKCGTLCFYFICSTRVSDFIVLFRRLILSRIVSASAFYNEDYFTE